MSQILSVRCKIAEKDGEIIAITSRWSAQLPDESDFSDSQRNVLATKFSQLACGWCSPKLVLEQGGGNSVALLVESVQ